MNSHYMVESITVSTRSEKPNWVPNETKPEHRSEHHKLETYHRVKTAESSASSETGETHLGDGGVDYALLAEAVQKTLGDLVGTVVLSNLLTEDEDLGVALELFGQGLVEGISDSVLLDTGAFGVRPRLGGAKVNGASKSAGVLGERGGSGSLGGRRLEGHSAGRGRQASGRAKESRHDGLLVSSECARIEAWMEAVECDCVGYNEDKKEASASAIRQLESSSQRTKSSSRRLIVVEAAQRMGCEVERDGEGISGARRMQLDQGARSFFFSLLVLGVHQIGAAVAGAYRLWQRLRPRRIAAAASAGDPLYTALGALNCFVGTHIFD